MPKITTSFFSAALAVLAAAHPGFGDDLEVTVRLAAHDSGRVMAALHREAGAEQFPDAEGAVAAQWMKAAPGVLRFLFPDLPAGRYAVAVFHDENGNGVLDTNFFGVPIEGYGFSRSAKGLFGPPDFEQAAVEIPTGGETISTAAKMIPPPRFRAEVFGRGGLSLLQVSATDSISARAGSELDTDSVSDSRWSREFGGGAGTRLLYGNWGFEGSYFVLRSPDLTPSELLQDSPETASLGVSMGAVQSSVSSRADLVLASALRTFRFRDGAVELAIGFGTGWIRATDDLTDDLQSGALISDLEAELAAQGAPITVAEFVFEADRSHLVHTGSLSLGFRRGRFLIRPRVDVVWGPPLTTDMTILFDLGTLVSDPKTLVETTWSSTIDPTLVLFSVDIGFSFPR